MRIYGIDFPFGQATMRDLYPIILTAIRLFADGGRPPPTEPSDVPAMAMTDFFAVFPKLADSELRNITVGRGNPLGLPAGRYAFAESYCDEKGCDCRRVLIRVYSERSDAYIAHINLGFDSDDPMAGPFLDPLDYQGPQAAALMGFFTDQINTDPAYLARLHRHYVQFKERVEGRRYAGPAFEKPGSVRRVAATEAPGLSGLAGTARASVRREVKVGRNDPCPCGSGRKYKQCCMGKPQGLPAPAARPEPPSATAESPYVWDSDPVQRAQIEQLIAAIAFARLQRKSDRWAAEVQHALEVVHPMAFDLLHLLLERYAPDGRQRAPSQEYRICLELLQESLTQIRYSVERRRPTAIALAERLQQEIAKQAFRPEVDVQVQQDLTMALYESKLELHPSIRDKAAEVAGYYARFGARSGGPSLDGVLERLVQQIRPRDAFDLIEPMLAEMALLPAEGAVGLAAVLMESSHPVVNELAVVLLLHPDPQVRTALPSLYREPGRLTRLDPVGLRRLIGLRNWLPAQERPGVDALIEAARRAGIRSAPLSGSNLIGVYASALDGSGSQACWLAAKDRRRYRMEGLLVRHQEGLREAFSQSELTKRELDSGLHQIVGDLGALPIRLDYLQRLVGHCIAAGHAHGSVPPPQVLVTNEWAGGDYWKPQPISATGEIERLSAADPKALAPDRVGRALADAGGWPGSLAFANSWFEDDAQVEDLLNQRVGKPERWMARLPEATGAVLNELLEQRRESWVERLVLMALWAEAARARPPAPWQSFLANAVAVAEAPLAEVPLMRAIAERTVEAAWGRQRARG